VNCDEALVQLNDLRRGRLDPAASDELAAHLERCAACSAIERSERALDGLLAERLPRYSAPDALKRRLALLVGAREVPKGERRWPAERRSPRRWARGLLPALAASVALVTGVVVWRGRTAGAGGDPLTAEVVNDHLRVLASQHPLDVESGGAHQVKPWFEGKLDFAPDVPSAEGADLLLRGGGVGYVFDRRAAVIVYALRLHVVTLLVFPSQGLTWPGAAAATTTPALQATSARGFNVIWWRAGALGYALVSDVTATELADVGARLARGATNRPPR
jgi:anti-sigma factor RsiW